MVCDKGTVWGGGSMMWWYIFGYCAILCGGALAKFKIGQSPSNPAN